MRSISSTLMMALIFATTLGVVTASVSAQSVYEWIEVNAPSPAPEMTWELTFDVTQEKVVAARRGGFLQDLSIWNWNGQAWNNINTPGPESANGVLYHDHLGVVYRLQSTGSLKPMRTWVLLTGVGWVIVDTNGPTSRSSFGWAYDNARSRSVVFGGRYGLQGPEAPHTWEWDGNAWIVHQAGKDAPPRRDEPAMAYDAERGVCVLFGGKGEQGDLLADTWVWNGVSWQLKSTQGPSARTGASMSYDPARQVILLFGGIDENDNYFGDLWQWDGASWTQVPLTGPSGRMRAGFTYDSTRGEAILFSGFKRNSQGETVPLPETWRLRIREAWVDFSYVGVETGAFNTPFNSLFEAVNAMPPGGRVHIKPGTSSETFTIFKELQIDAPLGAATIGL